MYNEFMTRLEDSILCMLHVTICQWVACPLVFVKQASTLQSSQSSHFSGYKPPGTYSGVQLCDIGTPEDDVNQLL